MSIGVVCGREVDMHGKKMAVCGKEEVVYGEEGVYAGRIRMENKTRCYIRGVWGIFTKATM